MRTVESKNGCSYKLLKTCIKESGRYGRYITFAELRANLPKLGRSNHVYEGLHTTNPSEYAGSENTWLSLRRTGALSIGCVNFDPKASATIFRAAGIRIGHAKKGKKKAATKAKAKR